MQLLTSGSERQFKWNKQSIWPEIQLWSAVLAGSRAYSETFKPLSWLIFVWNILLKARCKRHSLHGCKQAVCVLGSLSYDCNQMRSVKQVFGSFQTSSLGFHGGCWTSANFWHCRSLVDGNQLPCDQPISLYAKGPPPASLARHIINNTGTINATLIIGLSVKEMSSAWVDQESYSALCYAAVDHDDRLSKN